MLALEKKLYYIAVFVGVALAFDQVWYEYVINELGMVLLKNCLLLPSYLPYTPFYIQRYKVLISMYISECISGQCSRTCSTYSAYIQLSGDYSRLC